MKSRSFLVHRSAPRARAHAAIARSTSLDLGLVTLRYNLAAISASREPKGRASSAGKRLSCEASSILVLGPRRHSKSTREGIFIRSPRSMAARNRGSALLGPVSASIKIDVSSRIIRPPNACRRCDDSLGSLRVHYPPRGPNEWAASPLGGRVQQACECALPHSVDRPGRGSCGLPLLLLGSSVSTDAAPRHSVGKPSLD